MRLSNTIWGVLLSRFGRVPFYARLHVTHRCTQHCRMCQVPDTADRSTEMGLAEYAHIAHQLARLNVPHVVVTGGEPFVRPDLPEIVYLLAAAGLSVRVQTNGGPHLTEDLLRRTVQAGLSDVSVSIDTLDREKQDYICNNRNVVENALSTLRLCGELLPHGISQANVVASSFNMDELPRLVKYFHEMGSFIYITPVMISPERGDGWLFREAAPEFGFTPAQAAIVGNVVEELIEQKRHGYRLTNSTRYLRDFVHYARGGSPAFPCEAGDLSFDIHPDGGVSVCKERPPFMNILDKDFASYYRTGEYQELVRDRRAGCAGCFYGEYREPWYVTHDFGVFMEWTHKYLRRYRRGHTDSNRRGRERILTDQPEAAAKVRR